jgi:hypothetical protein
MTDLQQHIVWGVTFSLHFDRALLGQGVCSDPAEHAEYRKRAAEIARAKADEAVLYGRVPA